MDQVVRVAVSRQKSAAAWPDFSSALHEKCAEFIEEENAPVYPHGIAAPSGNSRLGVWPLTHCPWTLKEPEVVGNFRVWISS